LRGRSGQRRETALLKISSLSPDIVSLDHSNARDGRPLNCSIHLDKAHPAGHHHGHSLRSIRSARIWRRARSDWSAEAHQPAGGWPKPSNTRRKARCPSPSRSPPLIAPLAAGCMPHQSEISSSCFSGFSCLMEYYGPSPSPFPPKVGVSKLQEMS